MSVEAVRDAMERGLTALREQRLEEAVAACRAALALGPDHAEAHSLAGLALAYSGRVDEALRHLGRAVELEPGQPGFRFNLAEGLIAARRYEGAVRELRAAVNVQPEMASAWARLGDVHELQQDDGAAADAWAKAYAIGKAVPPIFKLALTALRYGRTTEAMEFIQTGLVNAPNHPALLSLQCDALTDRRDWAALGLAARAWLRVQPDVAGPWRALSRAAFEEGRHREAVETYARYLTYGTRSADELATFAGLALHALDFEAAGAALAAVDELSPGHTEALARRALLDMYHGRFEAAEAACLRVLEQQPEHAAVYTILSRLRRGRLDDAQLERVRTLAGREDADLDRRIPAAFAIGHALDASGEIDAAFAAYSQAHELALRRDRIEGRRYDPAVERQLADRLIELFPGPQPAPEPRVDGPTPIFVVGAPRSGTTLVESVLGAHSRVLACGERSTMQQMLRGYVDADARGIVPTDADLVDWTRRYLADVPPLGAKDHFTDKHPLNLAAVGLIARLFPDAKIVLVRRDPVETCLSTWRQEFPKHWQFLHRLEDLGAFYAEHSRLAAHWERVLPGRIVPIRYEEFAADFENAAPALVRACGLDWEPQCLDVRGSPNAIATFSTVDVREPVSVRNRRAAPYRPHLAPLIDALRAGGVTVAGYA
jgi:tetratricopeptide (TPR) repeat protein